MDIVSIEMESIDELCGYILRLNRAAKVNAHELFRVKTLTHVTIEYQHDLSPIKCIRDFVFLVQHRKDVCALATLVFNTLWYISIMNLRETKPKVC